MTGIDVAYFKPDGVIEFGDASSLDNIGSGKGWWWINLADCTNDDEMAILARFGINSLAVQDAQRERHPPKLEVFDDHLFLLLRDLLVQDFSGEQLSVAQLSIFAKVNLVITRQSRPAPTVTTVWQQVTAATNNAIRKPADLVALLLRTVADRYFPAIALLEEQLGDIEDNIFENPSDAVIEKLSHFSQVLKRMRRNLSYQREIMSVLRQPIVAHILTFDKHAIQDAYEQMERMTSLAHLNEEIAADILNSHLAIAAHRLNIVMRTLTIATVIFLPLGLIAGIYGMNFEIIPETKWRFGYFMALGFMAGIATTMLVVFRRLRWL